MKTFTKSMMGLAGLLVLGWSAKAQMKECDLSLSIISPLDYSKVAFGDSVSVEMELKNNGKDAVSTTDTLYFGIEGSNIVFHYHGLTIPPGGVEALSSPIRFVNQFENGMEMTVCMLILDQKDVSFTELAPNGVDSIDVPVAVTYNDPEGDNNFGCVTLTMDAQPKTSVTTVSKQRYLNIYPNPANDFLNLDMPELHAQNAMITVRDITGRVVMEQNYKGLSTMSSTLTINIAPLRSGLYFVELNTGNTSVVGKVNIQ